MSRPIAIDSPRQHRTVSPPIVDFLCHDPQIGAFVAEFVPQSDVSGEQKESVYLYDATTAARRLRELLGELKLVCGLTGDVARVAHSGGGNFSIHTDDGGLVDLRDGVGTGGNLDAYAVLQTLGQEIQLEFLLQRRTPQRQAV